MYTCRHVQAAARRSSGAPSMPLAELLTLRSGDIFVYIYISIYISIYVYMYTTCVCIHIYIYV